MSLLEDRLVRILDLRKLDKDDGEIASALELSPEIVRDYESRVHEEIRRYPHNSSAMLGRDLGVSSLVVELYRDYLSNLIYNADLSKLEEKAEKTPEFEWNKNTIKEFRKKNNWSRKEFANNVGCHKSAVYFWEEGRFKPGKSNIETLDKLKQSIEGKTVKVTKRKRRTKREQDDVKKDDVRKIQELLDYGISKMTELAEVTGIDYRRIWIYNKEGLIKLPREGTSTKPPRMYGKIAEHKDSIDKMIAEGASQTDITSKVREVSGKYITREGIRQYIIQSNRYEKWKKAQLKIKSVRENEKTVERNLVSTIYNIALKKAEEGGYKEAVEYYLDKGNRSTTRLKKLIKLVKAYKSAKNNGEKLSYKKLADISGFKHTMNTERYLKKMGFQSLCWTTQYLDNLQKDSIKKAYNLGLNSIDIAYFLDKSPVTISINLMKQGKDSRHQPKRGIQEIRIKKQYGWGPSYREASQIYGFTDEMNSTPEEIANALDIKMNVVETALNYRNKIEPKLTSALQILFPHERINKPYR